MNYLSHGRSTQSLRKDAIPDLVYSYDFFPPLQDSIFDDRWEGWIDKTMCSG